jgi:CheY-like chemotaxis protein
MKKRALIAEDNEELAYIFSDYMEESGVVSDFARNGKEALEMATKTKYDLILMDIYMPTMGGIEATGKIISLMPNTTIVVITSSNERLECERMKLAGAKDCLVKPVNRENLLGIVAKHLS